MDNGLGGGALDKDDTESSATEGGVDTQNESSD